MSSKNQVKGILRLANLEEVEIMIIKMIIDGLGTNSVISKALEISKQNLNHHLNKLIKQNLITRITRGKYSITDYGKRLHAEFVTNSNKQLIQLENMRYKARIYSGIKIIMNSITHIKTIELKNNVTQYTGLMGGYSVRVFVSKKSAMLEITCKKETGADIFQLLYESKKCVENLLSQFKDNLEVKIGILEESMRPDIAIPHSFAEEILDATGTSQIRTDVTVINRSKGRNADWETHQLDQARKVLSMPDNLERVMIDVDQIKTDINQLKEDYNIPHRERKDYPMYG